MSGAHRIDMQTDRQKEQTDIQRYVVHIKQTCRVDRYIRQLNKNENQSNIGINTKNQTNITKLLINKSFFSSLFLNLSFEKLI